MSGKMSIVSGYGRTEEVIDLNFDKKKEERIKELNRLLKKINKILIDIKKIENIGTEFCKKLQTMYGEDYVLFLGESYEDYAEYTKEDFFPYVRLSGLLKWSEKYLEALLEDIDLDILYDEE